MNYKVAQKYDANKVINYLKNEKMTSTRIKDCLFSFYRFEKGMFVASEVPFRFNISDIVLANKDFTQFIEIEIKISKADFLNDFKKQKYQEEKLGIEYPFHKFYFCVSLDLKDFCLQYLTENNLPYGLLTLDNYPVWLNNKPLMRNILTIKKAKKMTNESVEAKQRFTSAFLKRITSELANLHEQKYFDDSILDNLK